MRSERKFNILSSESEGVNDKSSKVENIDENKINTTQESPLINESELIIEDDTSVSYLGVKLNKAQVSDGVDVPKREWYTDFVNDKELTLPLQRDVAIAFLSGEPLLIEGGTSLGKTTVIKKMAAELGYEVHYANLNGSVDVEDLMGRYIPNSDRKTAEDPEYIFVDGRVTSGLRQEEGKVKVIILDEFNSAAPNILIRLHEVLDNLERGGDVILSEDASEAVSVNKERTKIVALMNPPGKGYFGREPLDPAQLRRWVYHKLPSELPEETFSDSTDALFNLETELKKQDIKPEVFLKARETVLVPEQFQEIPGIREIVEKYKEFHKGAKELLKSRKIAEDQPQLFTYDDRMEPRRVRDFILRFYRGDINESFQQALEYYYVNKLESEVDRKKLRELVRLVECHNDQVDSKRRGLKSEKEVIVEELIETEDVESSRTRRRRELIKIETAKEILGEKNVLGPEEIEKAFGIKIKDVPSIILSSKELENAKKLNQMLVLRVDKTMTGQPMSIENMVNMMTEKWKGKFIYSSLDKWKENYGKDLIEQETPRSGWVLVNKEVLEGSINKNYLEQTEIIVESIKNQVFEGIIVPAEYTEAIQEFEDKKEDLKKLIEKDWKQAAQELSELKITKMTRQTASEVLYDLALYYDTNEERLLGNRYTWTMSRDSGGYLMILGYFNDDGLYSMRGEPSNRNGNLGVSFSRRL